MGLGTCDLLAEDVALTFSRVPSASLSRRFIEEKSSFEYGQVNHALAAAMRTLVKEYLILVTQLEQLQRQGLLSLQKLWFYIQPAMRTVDILASLGTRLPAPQPGQESRWGLGQRAGRFRGGTVRGMCRGDMGSVVGGTSGQGASHSFLTFGHQGCEAKACVASCFINLQEENSGSSRW